MHSASNAADLSHSRRGLRYLTGSALCALVNNVVLITVDATGGPLFLGVLVSWILGGLTGYFWHSRFTYAAPLSFAALMRFMTGALFGIPLAWAALWLLTELIGLSMWLAGPAATAILFLFHYANAFAAIHWHKIVNMVRPWLR